MNRFKKKPLKTKTNTMNKTIIIAIALLSIFMAYSGYKTSELKKELIGTTQAYEHAIQPTELERLTEELELNRVERVEMQKAIDMDVWKKKKKSERADQIQERILEITGVNAFQK